MKERGFEIISTYQDKAVELPKRNTAASAGYDIRAAEDVLLAPQAYAMVPTGIKAYMKRDEALFIYIRSSLAVKDHLTLTNSIGVIDADYYNNPKNEGHIFLALLNRGDKPVQIEKNMRIAQGIFQKYLLTDDDDANVIKRIGGFGSTGKV